MRDWRAFVRARLSLPQLAPEREARIIREIAAQLEDFYRDARARGATEAEADAHARAQIDDWRRMAREVGQADRPHQRPRIDRLTSHLVSLAHSRRSKKGALIMAAHVLTDMHIPFAHDVFSMMTVMVRTSGSPGAFAAAARQAVRDIDGNLPAFAIAPLTSVITESVAQRRFTMLLIAVFALVALFLAAVGLYGVVAYAVSQRTQELGLRMAIGAQRSDLLRMVLGSGMKLALIGVLIGLGAALALARSTSSMLFGVTPFDPWSYGGTAVLLLAVAALACYVPARRAATVDPLVALRAE